MIRNMSQRNSVMMGKGGARRKRPHVKKRAKEDSRNPFQVTVSPIMPPLLAHMYKGHVGSHSIVSMGALAKPATTIQETDPIHAAISSVLSEWANQNSDGSRTKPAPVDPSARPTCLK